MLTPVLADLVARLRKLPRAANYLYVFTNRDDNPYAEVGITAMWDRVMPAALADGVVPQRFTFHDLGAYYTTRHNAQYDCLLQPSRRDARPGLASYHLIRSRDTSITIRVARYRRGTMVPICTYSASLECAP